MAQTITLQAKQINHGQSEIWLESGGQPVSRTRTLATNEVVNVARRHCSAEEFEAFYREYHLAVGHIASLSCPTLNNVAAELKLKG